MVKLVSRFGGTKVGRLDVAVVGAVNPVAQVVVFQAAAQQRDDTGLGALFDLADCGHSETSALRAAVL